VETEPRFFVLGGLGVRFCSFIDEVDDLDLAGDLAVGLATQITVDGVAGTVLRVR
jgi:hypothetical protein